MSLMLMAFLFSVRSFGQFGVAPLTTPSGGFDIDGRVVDQTGPGPGGINYTGADWVPTLFTTSGVPAAPFNGTAFAGKIFHKIDPYNDNVNDDEFAESDKLDDDPNTWNWRSGAPPMKDDINNALGFITQTANGHFWFLVSGDRLATNGTSYLDIEFYQAGISKQGATCTDPPVLGGTGVFCANGPHGGRTIGDLDITLEYTSGGSLATISYLQWKNVGTDANPSYDYVEINPPAGAAFVATNGKDVSPTSVPYGAFGSTTYDSLQFVETAVDLTMVIGGSVGTVCDPVPYKSCFVKTKSSASKTAQLKDFIEPFTVNFCIDHTPPVITVTSTASTALGCNPSTATINATLGGATASDNCAGAITPTSSDGVIGSTGCTRSQTRTWTVSDPCDNTATASRTVTWTYDVTPPVVTPTSTASTTLGCGPNSATISSALGVATVSDNCSTGLTATSSDGTVASSGCARSQTRTWTATDGCGNTGTASRTVTWSNDITPPTITPTCTLSTTLGCNPSSATIDVALGTATASANCSGSLTPTATDGVVGSSGCARSQTRTWTAADGCGNTATASRTVTWTFDITPPVITPTCTLSTTLGCNPSSAAIDVALGGATASDNCSGVLTPTSSDGSVSSTGCARSQTRTWYATDACGNTATASRTVTWTSSSGIPVITLTTTLPTALGCNPSTATINETLGVATATDNCSGALTITVSDGSVGSSGCARSETRIFTATDACGNTASLSRTVTWTFNLNTPLITPTCTLSTVLGCNPSSATIDLTLGGATASDLCDGVLTATAYDGSIGSSGCARSETRIFSATDVCGNTASASRTVTWTFDNTPPVITPSCTLSTVLGCNPTSATIDVALGGATANDDCSGELTATANDGSVGSSGCARSETRTFRATDVCGNTATASRTVTWTFDNTPPVITPSCTLSTVLGCNPSSATIEVALGGATANDNCSGELTATAYDGSVGSSGCARSETRTFRATDACGNTGTASRTVTWTFDNTPPVITPSCTLSTVLGCNPSSATIEVALGGATVNDNCSSELSATAYDGSVGSSGCARSETRTFRATDACGNTASASRTVTWTFDNTPPVITPSCTLSTVLGCNPSSAAIDFALGGATVNDNCSSELSPTAYDGAIGSSGCARSETRTFRATDACGNTASASRTVTWTFDNTPPVITPSCTLSTVLGCNPSSAAIDVALGGATVNDNCSSELSATAYDGVVGSSGCARSETRTFRATDACGNTASASRTVTWTFDNTPPVITPSCTLSTVLGCNPSSAAIDVALGGATVNDNCSSELSATAYDGVVSSSGCARSETRTFRATDACGNTASASRTVTWTFDNTPPVITPSCTLSTVLGCNPSSSAIDVALGGATVNDNCSSELSATAYDGSVGSSGCARSETRTFRATDACGNTASASRTVTWTFDNTPPVITPSSTLSTVLGCNPSSAAIDVALGGATVNDNCSSELSATAYDGVVSSSGCARSETRTFRATDGCGNTASASRTVTWTFDNTPPVITPSCTLSTVLGCNPSSAAIDFALGGATVNDNCSSELSATAYDGSVGSSGCARSETRTFRATDACGNTASASRTVTWTFDNTPPVITPSCTLSTVLGCNPSSAAIDVALGGATVNDNCSSELSATAYDGVVSSSGCARSETRTFRATDACGNTASASRTVTWTFDITPPVITPSCTLSTAIGCNPSSATINVTLGEATAWDNCSGTLTATTYDESVRSTGCARSETRIFRATDACGNTASASRTVTWTFDITPPVITPSCTLSTALGCNPSSATINVTLGGATAWDNCSGTITATAYDESVRSTGCARSETRIFRATDACGNTASASRTVTWTFDITPPVITPSCTLSTTLGCNPSSATINVTLGGATAWDNCSGTLTATAYDESVRSTGCERSETRIFRATDACGNTASASRTVTWTFDITPPVITPACTLSTSLGCNPSSATINTTLGGATAWDNCSGTLSATAYDESVRSTGCARSETRIFRATDACGNTASASRTVTWTFDITPPVITPSCTLSTALGCNPSSATINVTLGGATAWDNCSGTLTATAYDESVRSTGCSRSETRIFRATDACGNTASASRTVTWTFDITPPVITPSCTLSTVLGCNPSSANINVTLGGATANDNCSGAITPTSYDSPVGSSGCARSETRIFRATDACGNTATASRTVTWTFDINPPVITATCTLSTAIGCNPSTATIGLTLGDATATASCSLQSFTHTDGPIGSTGCARSETRTWFATDGCGNTASRSRTVTWTASTVAPTLSNLPTNVDINCDASLPTVASVTANDVCDGNITNLIHYTQTIQSTDCSTGFRQIVTRVWSVADACGNSASFTQTIRVRCCATTVCTLTQGAYGNAGGNICLPNGQTVNQTQIMITALAGEPGSMKVFGRQDLNRYWVLRLTDVNQGSGSNIFKMLPGGGPSQVFGLDTYAGVPEFNNTPSWPVAPLQATGPQAGKIRNVLFAQTITLYFNTKITGNGLANIPLGCKLVLASRTCGSANPGPPPYETVSFANYTAIAYILNPAHGYPGTVAGLLQLANDMLGGVSIPGVSLDDVNNAVSAINEKFDECKILVSTDCTNTKTLVVNDTKETDKQIAGANVSVSTYPNPFRDNIKFVVQSTISGDATLEVYNMNGAKLQVVYNGYIAAGAGKTIDYKVPELLRTNMIYVLRIGDKVVTGKVINIR